MTALTWGTLRLHNVFTLPDTGLSTDQIFAWAASNWTFGQVVAVIMLVAPLVTIIGYFRDRKSPKPLRQSIFEFVQSKHCQKPSLQIPNMYPHKVVQSDLFPMAHRQHLFLCHP